MGKLSFVQVDVFADTPFGGNPVVVIPEPGHMTHEQMQRVARGMNFAETSFVVTPNLPGAAFGLRCYTPTTELSYSGHQLIGTAYVLAERGLLPLEGPVTEVDVQIGDVLRGVRIEREDERIVAVSTEARVAEFVHAVGADAYGRVAAALSIDPMAILQTGLPVQLVRTGLSCLIVPIDSLQAIRELIPVEQALDDLLQGLGGDCLLAFTRGTLSPQNHVHTRVFAPPLGISEDPATGAANGALIAYLHRHGEIRANPHALLRSEQGSETGRPSLITIELDASADPPAIRVGGSVQRSAEGSVFF